MNRVLTLNSFIGYLHIKKIAIRQIGEIDTRTTDLIYFEKEAHYLARNQIRDY
jgi:hypothetical protein